MWRMDSLGPMHSLGQMDCDDAPAGEGCGWAQAASARLGSALEPGGVHENDAHDDDMDEQQIEGGSSAHTGAQRAQGGKKDA